MLTFDNRAFRDAASQAPYEFVEILVNGQTYGGGGIYNLYATVAADSAWAPYIFVHEFGHHFAGLADEYYTSDVAYQPAAEPVEPWEPNATVLEDPARLKWKDLVTPGTPLPTPWAKEAFEAHSREVQAKRRAIRAANRPEAEMDALFREEQAADAALLAGGKHGSAVGAFEGANYEARGYYRPQADCIMFTRDAVPFCAVCRRALERVIDLYTDTGAKVHGAKVQGAGVPVPRDPTPDARDVPLHSAGRPHLAPSTLAHLAPGTLAPCTLHPCTLLSTVFPHAEEGTG